MDWPVALALGAVGGATVEIINLWANLAVWQQHRKLSRRCGKLLPSWSMYFDPWPDIMVAATRLSLGALAGVVFHNQVTGQMAMIAVGAAAPALLRQFGAMRTARDVLASDSEASDASGAPAHYAELSRSAVPIEWAPVSDPRVIR